MAIQLLSINDIYNIKISKYIIDTDDELNSIPVQDKTPGTEVLVIETGKTYKLNSSLEWIEQKGSGSGGSITVDNEIDDTSTNPVQNMIIAAALENKQNALTAGNGITISGNTISASGGGDIELVTFTASAMGTGGSCSHTFNQISTAVQENKLVALKFVPSGANSPSEYYILNSIEGTNIYFSGVVKGIPGQVYPQTSDSIVLNSITLSDLMGMAWSYKKITHAIQDKKEYDLDLRIYSSTYSQTGYFCSVNYGGNFNTNPLSVFHNNYIVNANLECPKIRIYKKEDNENSFTYLHVNNIAPLSGTSLSDLDYIYIINATEFYSDGTIGIWTLKGTYGISLGTMQWGIEVYPPSI